MVSKANTALQDIISAKTEWYLRLKTAWRTYCCFGQIEKSYFIQKGQLELQINAQQGLSDAKTQQKTEHHNKTTILLFMASVAIKQARDAALESHTVPTWNEPLNV